MIPDGGLEVFFSGKSCARALSNTQALPSIVRQDIKRILTQPLTIKLKKLTFFGL